MNDFFVGLDLGQSQDYTALCVLEEVRGAPGRPPEYHGRYLERYPLGTPYPTICADVKNKLTKSAELRLYKLIVDATGVGAPVVDMLKDAGLEVIAVTITGGNEVSGSDAGGWSVPKRDLVSATKVLMQTKRLKFNRDMRHVDTLVKELLNFKIKISVSGHDSYEAWRENIHDDLVLSLCLPAWYATRAGPGMLEIINYGSFASKRARNWQNIMKSARSDYHGE